MATEQRPDRPGGVYINAVIVAQDAFRDDRGRTHIIGVFDKLTTPTFPLAANFTVWCSIKGYGSASILMRLIDADDHQLVVTGPLAAEVTPFKGHEWFVVVNTTFPRPGLYKLVALIDGTPATEVPLMVWQTDQEPTAASGTGPAES